MEDRGLAEAVLVKLPRGAGLENRVQMRLLPVHPVRGTGDTKALDSEAVLAQVEKIVSLSTADNVGVADSRFIPLSRGAGPQDRSGRLFPAFSIGPSAPNRFGSGSAGRLGTNTSASRPQQARNRWRRCSLLPSYPGWARGPPFVIAPSSHRQRISRRHSAKRSHRSRSKGSRVRRGIERRDGFKTSTESQLPASPGLRTGASLTDQAPGDAMRKPESSQGPIVNRACFGR